MARIVTTTIVKGKEVKSSQPVLKKNHIIPDITKMRCIRVDCRTVIYSGDFKKSESEIIRNWIKIQTNYRPLYKF